MDKVFFHPDGTPSPNPTSRDDALRRRARKYDERKVCPDCEQSSVRYTASDRCIHCARAEAMAFYNNACAGHDRVPIPPARLAELHCLVQKTTPADGHGHARPPVSPQEAVAWDCTAWLRPEPCPAAGHIGLRTVDGDCYLCTRDKGGDAPSPRQRAIAAGERWYTPDTPCPKCHTRALRHVNNGRCRGCHPAKGQADSETQAFIDAMGDALLSRDDAKALGVKVYRTGKPCKRGHNGWRYVSTSGCVDCRKGAAQ